MVFWVPILSWVAAIVLAAIGVWSGPRPIRVSAVAEQLLRYILLIPVGLVGLWAFIGHVFFPEQSAASIGWATSPFQTEVGMANLGIGVAGVIGAFFGSAGYRAAVAIMVAAFLGGAGSVHVVEIAETGNMAEGNAGPILYTDFLTPLIMFALLLLQRTALAARKLL